MAFKLGSATAAATYRWPVKISFPVDGKMHVERFVAEFKRLKHDRAMELIAAMNRFSKGDRLDSDPTEVEAAREVLAGWDEVTDAEGDPLPFTDRNVDELLSIEFAPFQLLTQWAESKNEAKRKN